MIINFLLDVLTIYLITVFVNIVMIGALSFSKSFVNELNRAADRFFKDFEGYDNRVIRWMDKHRTGVMIWCLFVSCLESVFFLKDLLVWIEENNKKK
jgi:hypothetical protein